MLFYFFNLQLYEINDDPKRKEFLDDLFSFMQKRGKLKSLSTSESCRNTSKVKFK